MCINNNNNDKQKQPLMSAVGRKDKTVYLSANLSSSTKRTALEYRNGGARLSYRTICSLRLNDRHMFARARSDLLIGLYIKTVFTFFEFFNTSNCLRISFMNSYLKLRNKLRRRTLHFEFCVRYRL